MERFKLQCTISGKAVELQFDVKKMPGEKGPNYMVSIDGIFKGYIKKEESGRFGQMTNSLTEEDMLIINIEMQKLKI